MSLENKVAIVAGGGRDALAAKGAKVVVNYYNNEEEGKATAAAIKEAGGEAILVAGDMTKQEDVDNLVAKALEAYGGTIDVLINVVGGLVARKTLPEADADWFEFVMRLNLTTTFMTTKAVVPHMKNGGAIVNFASQAGRDGGGPGAWAYATSKGAVQTLTRGLSKELGPSGIRVNCVCPGMISTTFHDTFTKDAVRKNVAAATPLRREGQAAEVADLTVYLASSESSFVTGASIDINGGMYFS